jgi:hypothetical protein
MERTTVRAWTGLELIQYVNCTRSDETPMMVARRTEARDFKQSSVGASQPAVVHASGHIVLHEQIPSTFLGSLSQTPNRILQSDNQYGMLVYDTASNDYIEMIHDIVTPLQVMNACSSETLAEAERRRNTISPAANEFHRKLLISCLDRAPPNDLAMDNFFADFPEGWQLIKDPCESHMIFGVGKKTFRSIDEFISVQVAWTCNINEYANLRRWTDCIF